MRPAVERAREEAADFLRKVREDMDACGIQLADVCIEAGIADIVHLRRSVRQASICSLTTAFAARLAVNRLMKRREVEQSTREAAV